MTPPTLATQPVHRSWSFRSLGLLFLAWLILQIGGLFTPGLLDDVDSIYIEIGREMLRRHDYVTPYIDGIRFFDKPPLMYWMAAAFLHIFGVHDWAARLPLALCVLALLIATYGLGIRLFRSLSPVEHPDRGGLYAALALATSVGPYLYTRFYIPDILLALWMTLAVHLFLIALERIRLAQPHNLIPVAGAASKSPLLPCLAFSAVMALNVLTKGFIGLVFPIGFVLLYLVVSRQLPLLLKLHPVSSAAVFLVLAAPWHILAALRTPAIALPAGLGLPAKGGWTWFYLYNEHIARFLSKRIPHDYGQTPVWLFWLLAILWAMPWAAFLPASARLLPSRGRLTFNTLRNNRSPAIPLFIWIAVVMGFFTVSARQEYYSVPTLPALALLSGAALAWADADPQSSAYRSTLCWHRYLLLPTAIVIAIVCTYFAVTAPHPAPGTDLSTLLAANPEFYNLSLGHLFDLTGAAMGLFRGPLAAVAVSMLALGPGSYLFRRSGRTYAANLTLAAAATLTLLSVHEGLRRFYPILGSKQLAEAIDRAQQAEPRRPDRPADLILLDGELTSGSSLIFYTQQQVHLLNGRVNGLWYGSFWPDAPSIFESDSSLHQLWASPRRIFLFTYHANARTRDLSRYAPVRTLGAYGGKTVLTNQ